MSKTAKNPVTGDLIKTKSNSDKYRDNYDKIFRSQKEKQHEDTINATSTTPIK